MCVTEKRSLMMRPQGEAGNDRMDAGEEGAAFFWVIFTALLLKPPLTHHRMTVPLCLILVRGLPTTERGRGWQRALACAFGGRQRSLLLRMRCVQTYCRSLSCLWNSS